MVDDTCSGPASARLERLHRGADQCVKCGLCLQSCPTYRLERNEADSPRGRIALIQGLVQDRIGPTATTLAHLDGCLACRACEAVCPSHVPYGALVDDLYAELAARGAVRPSLLDDLLARWPVRLGGVGRYGMALAGRIAAVLVRLGLRRRLLRLGALQPRLPPPVPAHGRHPPASSPGRGRVVLHLGCVARLVDAPVLNAAVTLLTAAGWEVRIPPSQGCCGAIHLHRGRAAEAGELARRNISAFNAEEAAAVVSCASGCGAVLAGYPRTAEGGTAVLEPAVWDVSRFLLEHGVEGLEFRPLAARAVVQDPCTLRNVLGQQRAVYDLLRLVPGLQVSELPGNALCCGSAGTHLIRQPATAEALAAPKVAAALAGGADFLVTANVGCALNLRLGLEGRGPEVVHPVELLVRQLVR